MEVNKETDRTDHGNNTRRRPDKTSAHAHLEFGGEDRGDGLPEPFRDDVIRRFLDGEFEVWLVVSSGGHLLVGGAGGLEGFGWRGGYGEAPRLVDVGYVDVEPLPWQEL